MTVRYGLLHAAGIVAGALLGFLLQPAPEVVFLAGETAAPPICAPTLTGRPAPAAAEGEREAPVGVAPEDPWLEEFVVEEIVLVERSPKEERSVRGRLAVATLRALAGAADEAAAALGRALAAGATPSEVLHVCAALPSGCWIGVVEALRAGHPDAGWEPVELAQAATAAGEPVWAWSVLAAAFEARDEIDEDFLSQLLARDVRATARLCMARLREQPTSIGANECWVLVRSLEQAKLAAERVSFLLAALVAHPFDDDFLKALEDADPVAAEARALARVRERPDDLQAWRTLAAVREARGDAAGAQGAYLRIAEISPDRASLQSVLRVDESLGLLLAERAAADSQDDEILGTLGDAYVANGRLGAALDAYLRAYRLDPTDHMWLRAMHEIDPVRAEAALRVWAVVPRASDEIVGAYGQALLALGRREEAFLSFAQATRQDPEDYEWQFGLVEADPQRARPVLEKLVEEQPECPFRSSALGMAMAATSEREAGLERMEAAIAREPCYRLYSMLCKADETRGLAALRFALRAEPRNDEWHGVLAEVYARRGERAEALAEYETAHVLDPEDEYWLRRMELLRNP